METNEEMDKFESGQVRTDLETGAPEIEEVVVPEEEVEVAEVVEEESEA